MINPEAYQNSIDLLRLASTPYGFVAAVHEHDNYRRIWTRDGTITVLAALLSNDAGLMKTAKQTINTIFSHQNQLGLIPSNVTPETHKLSFGGSAGRADNPAWAVIGLCQYTIFTGDTSLANTYKTRVEKCFCLMEAWEYNDKHLIYVPQSGDWADEYIQHGYILLEQLLRYWALLSAHHVYGKPVWKEKAGTILETIRRNYRKDGAGVGNFYTPNLQRQLKEASDEYWLMGFNPARVYTYFDLQANAFALLLGMGTRQQDEKLLHWMRKANEHPFLYPSFYPAIDYADPDMRELGDNYAYSFRNKPGQFHNGGLWPVWNGWMAAALAKAGDIALAISLTQNIHEANSKEGNSFNECLNGKNQAVNGVPQCTWSAAGAIIAEQALAGKFLITT